MTKLTLVERIASIKPKDNIELSRLEEQIQIAIDLKLKGVAWALKMRHSYKVIKSLGYPTTTREQISKDLKIDEEKEVLAEDYLISDYNMLHYAGLMPYGTLLIIKEMVENKVCEIGNFKIFYPEIIPVRKDPILCIEFPNMDKISRFSNGGILSADELVLFKVSQWD